MKRRVFICYRRADTGTVASPLAVTLGERFGEDNVFVDKGLVPGDDFWEEIQAFLRSAHVVLVLIGTEWLAERRLADRTDYVRREIRFSWEHGTRVMPVLVQSARMPAKSELPRSLRRISSSHALELHTDTWGHDTGVIIRAIDHHIKETKHGRYVPLKEILATGAPVHALLWNAVARPTNWIPPPLLLVAAWWLQTWWLVAAAAVVFILLCAATFFDIKEAKKVARMHAARGDD